MATDLGRGRELDPALGRVGVAPHELPPLPDAVVTDPGAGRLDPRAWFADPGRPLEVEVGTGKGGFVLAHGGATPGVNVLGIEREGSIWAYASDRVRRRGLPNVRMLHADAVDFLRWRCPDSCVRVLHLYYSDPWPKPKHHKHRVVQHRFLAEAWRVLRPGGELRVATDHAALWAWCRERFAVWTDASAYRGWFEGGRADHGGAVSESACPAPDDRAPFALEAFTPPDWAEEGELLGTNYERKFRREAGHHACVLRKRGV
ncbi:MAG: methyltransferase domain-containing protein [Phycisphaerae bacterium]|nr:methyltransferase domain-containing protein [Phycisphaerae bacterium]